MSAADFLVQIILAAAYNAIEDGRSPWGMVNQASALEFALDAV